MTTTYSRHLVLLRIKGVENTVPCRLSLLFRCCWHRYTNSLIVSVELFYFCVTVLLTFTSMVDLAENLSLRTFCVIQYFAKVMQTTNFVLSSPRIIVETRRIRRKKMERYFGRTKRNLRKRKEIKKRCKWSIYVHVTVLIYHVDCYLLPILRVPGGT